MKKLLVILGPTATGKTDLSLALAKKHNGELISCDSRQVYKGLDIGTGKESGMGIKGQVLRVKKEKGFWEINGIKIWMYDVVGPKTQYTVKDYVKQASQVIEDIIKRGKLPIVVGGTGLYLKALLEGLPNLLIPIDLQLRRELQKLSKEQLQEKLQTLSPAKWKLLNGSDRQNPRRLLRSIELVSMNPYIYTRYYQLPTNHQYNLLKIGLSAPRETLKKRLFDRLLSRLDQGMIEEAKKLHHGGLSYQRMRELGLEYGVLADYLENKINQDELIKILNYKIGQYAKRQVTWFRKEKGVHWFDITEPNYPDEVEKLVTFWYDA